MLAETSSPRDSYYSSLFDEYSSRSEERAYIVGSTWSHATKNVKRRPSLNLHPRTNSISSLKRQPSFDCPSPSFSNLISSPNHSSPLNSLFNYTASGSFSPPPPSPGYVFTHYSSYINETSESLTSDKTDERSNSLKVPTDTKRNSAENRAPSPSDSSILEDYNYYHTRHSSASSFEDVSSIAEVTPIKRTSAQSQLSINENVQQQQQDSDRTFSRQNSICSTQSKQQRQDRSDRDQYGFRRSYQWITRKEYTEFESSYTQVLRRRKQKWDAAIAENGGVIPGRSSKMKRYIRKGIPPSLRGKVWFHYSGAEEKMRDHMDFYQQLLIKAQDPRYENEYAEVIERDLHRTFPENIKFKSTIISEEGNSPIISTDDVPIIQSLRRVLTAFSLYSPNIGYCQSLNYVVGILLLFMEEEEAFWMLVTIIHDYLPENVYDVTMEGANVDQAVLMMYIMEKMPQIWNKLNGGFGFDVEKLDGNMPTITLVTSHWFLTLYINILPIETLLRVWDCFFYEGNKVLFRVALAIFKLNEEKILSVDDPMEIFQVVQNMPKSLVDCHKLIDACFRRRMGVSQKDIDKRREFFRERRKKRVGSMLYKH